MSEVHTDEQLLPEPDPKKASETVLELLKQLIGLASGVLALSATFVDKLKPSQPYLTCLLAVSWLLLIGAVFAGLQAMSASVKVFHRPEFKWTERKLRNFARASKYCFIFGISAFALFAFLLNVLGLSDKNTDSQHVTIHAGPVGSLRIESSAAVTRDSEPSNGRRRIDKRQ